MQRVLITGATGLLGGNLVLQAADRGMTVTAVSNTHRVVHPRVRSLQLDLTDDDSVRRLVVDGQVDLIVHCAALTNVDLCEERPERATELNVDATRRVAVVARRLHATLVYISTDAVFDGAHGAYRETDEPSPINVYARTKLAGERAAAEEAGRLVVVRTTMYGWNMTSRSSLAEWALAQIGSGASITGFIDVVFSPLPAEMLASLLLELGPVAPAGIYHVGTTDSCTKYAFLAQLASVFGLDPARVRPGPIRDVPLRAPRPKDTSLIVAKAARALGADLPTVAEGLRHFWKAKAAGLPERLKAACVG